MPRNPKSNELKAMEGVRADRINVDEPMPERGIGDPPEELDAHGRAAWDNIVASWGSIPVLKRPDRESVVRYCELYSLNRDVSEQIKKDGLMIEEVTEIQTANATITKTKHKAHPLLPTMNATQRQMIRFFDKHGMTPASRAGLKVPTPRENNVVLKLMDERKAKRGRKPG